MIIHCFGDCLTHLHYIIEAKEIVWYLLLGNSEFIHSSTGFGRVNILSLDSTRTDFNSYFIDNLLHIKRFGNPETDPVKVLNHNWYK